MAPDGPAMDVAQLVADYHQAVYRYAFRLSGSVTEAEDLTQEVFLIAHRKGGQIRSEQSVRSWLFAVLRNCFLKAKQKRRPVPAASLKLNIDSIPEEVPGDEAIDRERLQMALDQLPPNYRVALVMFYFEDRSYREIAEELDLPIGTVMSRLARAKAHLRTSLFEPELGPAVGGKHAAQQQTPSQRG